MYTLKKNIIQSPISIGFFILLFFCSFPAFGQDERVNNPLFNVRCILPDAVDASSEFLAKFEITKSIGYVGPLNITQKLPNGFKLLSDAIPHAELTSSYQKFDIYFEYLPLGDTFSFELKIGIGKISGAVYPFNGMAHFFGSSISYSSFIQINSYPEGNISEGNEGHVAPIEIYFELPERIIPGTEFTFVTKFNKNANYLASGKIIQSWPGVFQPLPTSLQNGNIKITDNIVEVSWEKLDIGTNFSIAYQVDIKESAGGVYPVITNFEDVTGLKLNENLGVYVTEAKPTEPKIVIEEVEPLHRIWFDYPTRVEQGNSFELKVFIQKGKNTRAGKLTLKLPSGCKIENIDVAQSTYDENKGILNIFWDHLPASPVVEVKIKTSTKKVSKAVYLITSEFYQDTILLSSCSGHLFISGQVQFETVKHAEGLIAKPNMIDTTEVFSTIDSLLRDWKKSSNGKNQANPDTVKTSVESYRGQILASKKPLHHVNKLLLSMNIHEPLKVNFDGEYYRYTVGEFNTSAQCSAYVKFLQSKGFADAFVRKYVGDEPEK